MSNSYSPYLSRRNFLRGITFSLSGLTLLTHKNVFSAPFNEIKSNRLFTINVLDRPYDLHRPKGCTVLTIEYDGWEGNEFGLWLPETIYINDKIEWCNWSGTSIHQDWDRDLNGKLTWNHSDKTFKIISTLIPDEEKSCLWIRHTFENTSNDPLLKLRTQTCFHLVNAPQFISIKGERIWANLDGKWTTTDKVPRKESPDPRRVGFLKKGVRSERTVVPSTTFPSALMPEAAHHPLIIAENFGATASVGVASRNFRTLSNNNDSILRCIHSEPFPIEKLNPGETADLEAVILFCKGNREVMIEKYEKLNLKY